MKRVCGMHQIKSGSQRVMRQRLTDALKRDLAPPGKGNIRSYFAAAPAAKPAKRRSAVLESVVAACGRCVFRLAPELVALLQKVELLFYLEGAKVGAPNSVFTLQQMGVLQFVQYNVRPVSLFESPAQLEEYMAARRVLDQLEDHIDEERWKDRDEEVVREQRVRALLERADVSAAWLTEHREWDQDNVAAVTEGASLCSRRFRAAWVHARVVNEAVGLLEATPIRDHAKAVDWLRKLLRSPLCPRSRARWWNR